MLGFLAHARPDVGVDYVGAIDGVRRVAVHLERVAGNMLAEYLEKRFVEAVPLGRGEDEAGAELAADDGQRPSDVVAVADEHDCPARRIAEGLLEREIITQCLAGMVVIRQAVDDRAGRMSGEFLHRGMAKSSQY